MADDFWIRNVPSPMLCDCSTKAPTSSTSAASPRGPARRACRTNQAAKSPVTEDEELRRVMPVIEGIRKERPECVISIDTYKSGVARRAVEAGAEIVNDVSALQWDAAMAKTCAELRCGVVLMHTRGRPAEWRNLPRASDITSLVMHDLANRAQIAFDSGIAAAGDCAGSRLRIRQEL